MWLPGDEAEQGRADKEKNGNNAEEGGGKKIRNHQNQLWNKTTNVQSKILVLGNDSHSL